MSFVSEEFIIDRSRLVEPVLVTGAGGCIGAWVLGILAAKIHGRASKATIAAARLW